MSKGGVKDLEDSIGCGVATVEDNEGMWIVSGMGSGGRGWKGIMK